MKYTIRLTAYVCLVCLLLCLCACGKKDGGEEQTDHAPKQVDFATLTLSDYVRLGAYRDLEITLPSADVSRGDVAFSEVVRGSEILAYPEEQVAYYAEQQRATYRYYAKQKNATYEEILEANGVSEEAILTQAKKLTAEDLVYHAILQAEQITLEETEKSAYFDKYVARFVQTYGNSEAYVRENMKEQIYESMLYDKMLERLIMLNTFRVSET